LTNIFFIGDTHFGHKNILKFEPEHRPFKDIKEHDEILIQRWNSVVKSEDDVYHLGDVWLGGSDILKNLNRLNGKKRLILGNHDRQKHLKEYFQSFHGAMKFDSKFLLTHIPVNPQSLGFRFKYNIHGHTHSKNIMNNNIIDERYINVSCEQINLTPISYDDLKKRIKE
jgi:calcineurin-like phosphoesterase family protein